jgi:hypothetical protein
MRYDYDAVLAAVVEHPGSRACELPGANGAVLRYLRVAGKVTAEGESPKRWYPTASARRRVSEHRNRQRRMDARLRRLDALALSRRAEDLWAFADTLLEPARPPLPFPARRSLSFAELTTALKATVDREVLVTTDSGRGPAQLTPITSVGTVSGYEEDRSHHIEDWLLTLHVDGSSFVEFSRRHFEAAHEDPYIGELRVRQAAQTTVLWLDIDL